MMLATDRGAVNFQNSGLWSRGEVCPGSSALSLRRSEAHAAAAAGA
jgi:hypothetical protein